MKVPNWINVAAQTHCRFWDAMWDDCLCIHGQCTGEDEISTYMAGGEL